MAMKAAHSEDNADKNITGSTRQHIVSRLHKAVQTAKQIVDVLTETGASGANDTDVLEAKAYRYALAGAEEFEKQAEGIKASNASPQRWNTCLTNFSAARVIYSSLLKATKKDLFKEVLAGTTDPVMLHTRVASRGLSEYLPLPGNSSPRMKRHWSKPFRLWTQRPWKRKT
jgi:signal recognition particle subunit SRP68